MKNLLKAKLKAGKTVIGTWCMLPSSFVVDVIASSKPDFIIIDMEHGAMSFQTAEEMVRAAQVNDCQPIVRVTNSEEPVILHALEIGSRAVMVPHVSSAQTARRVAQAAHYAPKGSRGLSPYTRTHGYTHEGLAESLKSANREVFTGILVEGSEGLKNLPAILRVDGIDLVYLGVYDLSQSLGVTGRLDHPKVLQAVEKCARLIEKAGKVCGTFSNSLEMSKTYLECGIRFIAHGTDCFALKHFYTELLRHYRKVLR